MADSTEEHFVTTVTDNNETACWGCGLRLILPTYTPVFKCGWCGAITNRNERKCDRENIRWRRLRDRCFVVVLLGFIFFVIVGGVWTVYPVVFSVSNFCGIFHSTITAILAISTIVLFSLASFRCAGKSPTIQWGSYPVVGKGYLENYTFCCYCEKPKSPKSHHCRSCGTCVLNMDHHCPFIGNCVGASNHRHFIAFLISAIISMIYVTGMSVYTGLHIWPPLAVKSSGDMRAMSSNVVWKALREIIFAVLSSAVLLSARGLVLVYLLISSVAMEIGLSVLLWQQLSYIYEGQTYLSHLSSQRDCHLSFQGIDREGESGCKNIFRFFGCTYPISGHMPSFLRHLPIFRNPKRHKR